MKDGGIKTFTIFAFALCALMFWPEKANAQQGDNCIFSQATGDYVCQVIDTATVGVDASFNDEEETVVNPFRDTELVFIPTDDNCLRLEILSFDTEEMSEEDQENLEECENREDEQPQVVADNQQENEEEIARLEKKLAELDKLVAKLEDELAQLDSASQEAIANALKEAEANQLAALNQQLGANGGQNPLMDIMSSILGSAFKPPQQGTQNNGSPSGAPMNAAQHAADQAGRAYDGTENEIKHLDKGMVCDLNKDEAPGANLQNVVSQQILNRYGAAFDTENEVLLKQGKVASGTGEAYSLKGQPIQVQMNSAGKPMVVSVRGQSLQQLISTAQSIANVAKLGGTPPDTEYDQCFLASLAAAVVEDPSLASTLRPAVDKLSTAQTDADVIAAQKMACAKVEGMGEMGKDVCRAFEALNKNVERATGKDEQAVSSGEQPQVKADEPQTGGGDDPLSPPGPPTDGEAVANNDAVPASMADKIAQLKASNQGMAHNVCLNGQSSCSDDLKLNPSLMQELGSWCTANPGKCN